MLWYGDIWLYTQIQVSSNIIQIVIQSKWYICICILYLNIPRNEIYDRYVQD